MLSLQSNKFFKNGKWDYMGAQIQEAVAFILNRSKQPTNSKKNQDSEFPNWLSRPRSLDIEQTDNKLQHVCPPEILCILFFPTCSCGVCTSQLFDQLAF